MRRYLIDHARGRANAELVTLAGIKDLVPASSPRVDVALTVDRLVNSLGEVNPEWYMVVEMKYFLGLTDVEAAKAMGINLRTMQRMWSDARHWLFSRIEAPLGEKGVKEIAKEGPTGQEQDRGDSF